MKKIALLFSCALAVFATQAQVTLTGTSYTQDFDGIGGGYPTGWDGRLNATATALGDVTALFNSNAATGWQVNNGGFRNVASATGLTSTASVADQAASTNRALACRMVSASDGKAAFNLQIANTTGRTNFQLSFKLQSLDDTSARTATWAVQYGTGSNPSTFTTATATGTLTTGGRTWTNNTVTVNFGTGLDNISDIVWIRIACITPTSGSGNRPTAAIDDFQLSWSNSGTPVYNPNIVTLSPADNATNVATTSDLAITFDRQISKGTGNISIKNETDQTTQNIDVTSSNVTVSGTVATITGITLAQGKTYHVTYPATAFDTAGYECYGITDTTRWNFATVPAPQTGVSAINEQFNTACVTGDLPLNWTEYSVIGDQSWRCSGASTAPNYYMSMNGYANSTNNANEDWLITPLLDLSAVTNPRVAFRGNYRFAGDDVAVLISSDYDGSSSPATATWTDLNVVFTSADSNRWVTKTAPLTAATKYVAFKYTSSTAAAAQWGIDSVMVYSSTTSVNDITNANMPVVVLGEATSNQVLVGFNVESAGTVVANIYDITGREIYTQKVNAVAGNNRITLYPAALQAGMYFVRISNGLTQGAAKAVISR